MKRKRMSDEKRKQLQRFVRDVSQLDEQSLLQLQFAANVLLAREKMVMSSDSEQTILE